MRAATANGGKSTYAIDLSVPPWPVFSKNEPQMPWYFNAEPIITNLADTILKNQAKAEKLSGMGKMLEEVVIREKKIIKGSHNLNGPGNADQVIDEKDIAKAGKLSLLDLIKQYVSGFRTTGIDRFSRYFIKSEPLRHFIFDGIDPTKLGIPVYDLLTGYTSDDIRGIEVMYKAYTSNYETTYLSMDEIMSITFAIPFLEITTRDGIGPILRRKDPNFATYIPPMPVSAKTFYRPRYQVKNAALAAFDNRTTIHWEPNIVTDKNGKAIVSFYAAGQPATYTITTEGSNMDGSVGSTTQNIIIK